MHFWFPFRNPKFRSILASFFLWMSRVTRPLADTDRDISSNIWSSPKKILRWHDITLSRTTDTIKNAVNNIAHVYLWESICFHKKTSARSIAAGLWPLAASDFQSTWPIHFRPA